MGVGLILVVWIARYLGPEQFGLLSFTGAFVMLFSAIATVGLQGIVVRDVVREPEYANETVGTAAVMQLLGGVIAYILILGVIFIMRPDDPLAKTIVAIVGSMMLFKAGDVALYWFESQVLSKYIVWVQNGTFLVFAGIKVSLILRDAPLISFAWAMMGQAAVTGLLMVAMLNFRGPSIRQLEVSLSRAKGLLRDCWPLLLTGIAVTIYMKVDQIMLGQMLGDEAVGVYSAAVRISEVWYFIPIMIVNSVFPAILEAKKRSESLYYERLQRLYDLVVLISFAVALPMTFLSTPIVTLLFGSAYALSGTVLAIHVWGGLFVFLGVSSGKWLLAENRQILSFQRTFVGCIFNIGLNFQLIPRWGPVGAAVATVSAQVLAAWIIDCTQPITRKMFFMKLQSLNLLKSWKCLKSER